MKIDISKKEYKVLIEILDAADWVFHSHEYEKDPRKDPYDRVMQKVYSYATKMGMDNLIEYASDLGEYYVTQEFEETSECRDFIEEFENDTFWDELINRLAERDLIREAGSLEELYKMGIGKRIELENPLQTKYSDEFSENGIESLEVGFGGKK